MTVAELIAKLSALPPEAQSAEVYVCANDEFAEPIVLFHAADMDESQNTFTLIDC